MSSGKRTAFDVDFYRAWAAYEASKEGARNRVAVRDPNPAYVDGAIYSAFMQGFIAAYPTATEEPTR